jgi:alkylation response protein AidB-like acyl-CoA dehydrogenase
MPPSIWTILPPCRVIHNWLTLRRWFRGGHRTGTFERDVGRSPGPLLRPNMTETSEATDVDELRSQLQAWLHGNWDPEVSLLEWRTRLADSGWGCPTWPQQWCGRSLPAFKADVVAEELARAGAVGPPQGVGMYLAAPTILHHGADHVKGLFIRPTVTGEITWRG